MSQEPDKSEGDRVAEAINRRPSEHDDKRWLGAGLCNLANLDLVDDVNTDEAIERFAEAAKWLRQSLESDPRPNYLLTTLGNLVSCLCYHPDPSKRDPDRAAAVHRRADLSFATCDVQLVANPEAPGQ